MLKKMKSVAFIIIHLGIIVFLTVLTQIGGILYLLSELIFWKLKKRAMAIRVLGFCTTYIIFTLMIIPYLAPLFGREPIKNTQRIKPTNYLTVILNRNYVVPELNVLLAKISNAMESDGSSLEIRYLDGNLPFIKKFPLLPHLSHNDGGKLDLSLVYENTQGTLSNKKKSITGYGVFENPAANEKNTTQLCKKRGYYQYDYPKYLSLGTINDELRFSTKGTKYLLKKILEQKSVSKIFLEPHLVKRLKLSDRRLRFQGCGAVRHDDHIHIQIN